MTFVCNILYVDICFRMKNGNQRVYFVNICYLNFVTFLEKIIWFVQQEIIKMLTDYMALLSLF